MPFKYAIGIDISKATLDCCILENGEFVSHQKILNDGTAIKEWYKELRQLHKISKANTLFCFEQLGAYEDYLLKLLTIKKSNIWRESPLQIKRSLGIHRGKSDKIDSIRIAQYAHLHQRDFKPYAPPRRIIEQLRHLSSLRSRLKGAIVKLENGIRAKTVYFKDETGTIDLLCLRSIIALKMDLDATSKQILELIKGDERLCHLFKLITSVPYIGNVLGTELLIATNEFLNITCPKKFACFCGVVPFEHSSGTSVKKRARVSNMASRKMKALLHIAAFSSLCHEGELRTYYNRRINEGHAKMSVINAIRNKLIHRAFACVRDNRLYQAPEDYKRFEPTPYP